jgi:NAD(P)H-hydrate epimerase
MKQITAKQLFEKLPDAGPFLSETEETNTHYYFVEEKDIASMIPKRNRFAHKGNFGHALLIAGSRGKMGAAALAAKACLRSGSGLLTVHIPACGEIVLQTSIPEAMTEIDREYDFISGLGITAQYNAIAIGPGIGLNEKTEATLLQLFENANQPLVLDADAINLIARNENLQHALPANSILTPHAGELDRLTGNESKNAYKRLLKACEWAMQLNSYIVLKGANTAICTPENECYFNPTGNPGMATAGSGDALTGIILGLLSQSYSPLFASITGVFLHGLAGDIAAKEKSEESLIASDIIENLGLAFKKINYFCTKI